MSPRLGLGTLAISYPQLALWATDMIASFAGSGHILFRVFAPCLKIYKLEGTASAVPQSVQNQSGFRLTYSDFMTFKGPVTFDFGKPAIPC